MTKTLHIISHTHWDREWYLTFQQFRLKLVHLIDNLLDLLDKDADFKHFMLDGQTIILDDYLAIRPERADVLCEHVDSGRIQIGPWHILPDMFLVGPEAHIRNLLQGERTCRNFGPKMMVGYIPDPFGHPGQVPQILSGFGINTACVWRGLDDQPAEFWWEAPDGSRVLMAYLRESYSNGAGLPAGEPPRFARELAAMRDTLAVHSIADDFLIMYGTDHMPPPPDTSSAIHYANQHIEETRVVHSTLPAYLSAIQPAIKKADLPVFQGELRSSKRSHLLPGVLSTRMWIKQRNRTCENLLEKWAEPFSTWSDLLSRGLLLSYEGSAIYSSERLHDPAPVLRQAWRLLMENHPHDSICGCSIDQVHDEMRPRFDQVEQIGEEITRQSLAALAAAINTKVDTSGEQCSAIVVFNPSMEVRSDLVTVELTLPAEIEDYEIVDECGNVVPHQLLGSDSNEYINTALDRDGLAGIIAMLHEGRAANLSIQSMQFRREGNTVWIDSIMAENTAPNMEAWERGRATLKAYLDDMSVTTFQVCARSPESPKITFASIDVPGFGWRTFSVRRKPASIVAPVRISAWVRPFLPLAMRVAQTSLGQKLFDRLSRPAEKPPYRIENQYFRVAVAADGTLRVTDKLGGIVYHGLNRFIDGGDCGDEYNYCPPSSDRLVSAQLKHVKVQRGAVQQTLEIHYLLDVPKQLAPDRQSRSSGSVGIPIISRVSLALDVPRIDIQTVVENHAKDHRLRVHFPAPFGAEHADHDGHFEVVRRPIGLEHFDGTWSEDPRPEVPQRAFTSVSDSTHGLMIANHGLPEVEVLKIPSGFTGGSETVEIALTLLRCVGWLSRDDFASRRSHAGPFLETPGAQMPGTWCFDYAIIPHADDWHKVYPQAYAVEAPLRALSCLPQDVGMPAVGMFLKVQPQEFVISAIKMAEEGRGWLVRGYNIGSQVLSVRLVPQVRYQRAELVNLAEQPVRALTIGADGSVAFQAGAHEIVSVMFE